MKKILFVLLLLLLPALTQANECQLSWTPSPSDNVKNYVVYKDDIRQGESFELMYTILCREYGAYAITAVNTAGKESVKSVSLNVDKELIDSIMPIDPPGKLSIGFLRRIINFMFGR